MDLRAEKLAKARKKLRDHQEKKTSTAREDISENVTNNVDHLTSTVSENIAVEQTHDDIISDQQQKGVSVNTISEEKHPVLEKADVQLTEYLISNKTSLEMQINELNSKLAQAEYCHEVEMRKNHELNEKLIAYESELSMKSKTYSMALDDINSKESIISELQNKNKILEDENYNYKEQLELTKSMLTTKELDNAKLQNEVLNCYNQIEAAKLQIQQLTSDNSVSIAHVNSNSEEMKALQLKVVNLQQEIDTLKKDREQLTTHYEHYVNDLNVQLRSELGKKELLTQEIQQLYNRENSLIEQISEMEIRLQNFGNREDYIQKEQSAVPHDLEEKLKQTQTQLEEVSNKYENLNKMYLESLTKIKELSEMKEASCEHDNISLSKLNADITSDKVAAQKATEQNKKLKLDIEELEQVVVKMTKDKLELTEKLTHEKSLNKDLILKLTDIEENTKNMNNKLKAKDEEMMRLQSGYREIERKHGKLLQDVTVIRETTENCIHKENNENATHKHDEEDVISEQVTLLESNDIGSKIDIENHNVPKYDAMQKLQERFLKIMDEVANLSDEKQRLEHIILQLQSETDTICEYVALYQQQRSLLKKREEERNNQIKIFETECKKLKKHLEELRDILFIIVEDEKLSSFLKQEDRKNDVARIKKLLEILQSSSLLDIKFHKLDLNVFYPCSCCSGQLIDV